MTFASHEQTAEKGQMASEGGLSSSTPGLKPTDVAELQRGLKPAPPSDGSFFAACKAIADAVLFEGYMLYPYRPSALKNRQRWNFGTLYPRTFAHAQNPPERSRFSTQVLFEAKESTTLTACVRFLQLAPAAKQDGQSWEEGFPRSRTLEGMPIASLLNGVERIFDFTTLSVEEALAAPGSLGERRRLGKLVLSAECRREGLYRLQAVFTNESPAAPETSSHRSVQDVTFTSAHLLLALEHGSFVSLLEPAEEFVSEASACSQGGIFPVLAGEAGDRSHMLCSPIILYDYPQVAPESAGDFFDGAEMDEMLALRVLTLTDEEKAEMRRGDGYARRILERTEMLPGEQLMKTHGAIRGPLRATEPTPSEPADAIIVPWDPFSEQPPPDSVKVLGAEIRKGDRVRVWPHKQADILDMEIEGKTAIVEAIEQDVEGNIQLAVTIDDDPGRDLGVLRQIGHRFFYSPEEVEPLQMENP